MKAQRFFTIFFAICLVSSILAKLPVSYATVYSKPVVVLGMADGYENQFTICYPYLENKSLRPFFYPIADLNGSTFESQDTMNWTEINELIDEGYDLASHSATHPHLASDGLSEAELIAETQGSQETFKNETGVKPYFFIPPHGDINDTVIEYVNSSYAGMFYYGTSPFQYNATDLDIYAIPLEGLVYGEWKNGSNTDWLLGNLTQELDWLVGNGSSYATIFAWEQVFADISDCREGVYGDVSEDTWKAAIDIIYDYWQVGENITVKELNTLFSGVLLPLEIADITHDLISIMCDFVILAVVLGMFSKISKIKIK